jgi:hypothetical protein
MQTWVDVRDPEVIAELVGLINDRIEGRSIEDHGTEISVLSRHDPDAPKDLEPPVPGQRHVQVDMITEGARLRFVVGILGRPGSEMIGHTADELRAAAGGMHKVISDLCREGKLTAIALATLQENAHLLETPNDDPTRWQPINPSDFVVVSVYAVPERGE